jgi:mRNA interferase RelE/StbE
MKTVLYSKAALKVLGRMPATTSQLIRSKISQYAADPSAQANNVRALQGMAGAYRLRIGHWRVLFTEDRCVIAIVKVSPRGSAYE